MASKPTSSPVPEPASLSTDKVAGQLGEIVVFIDQRIETAAILEFAGVLAAQHGARLISVFMQPEPVVTPAETFARSKGMLSVMEVHRAQLETIEAEYLALFENIVRRHGIRSEWRSLPHASTEVGVLRTTRTWW